MGVEIEGFSLRVLGFGSRVCGVGGFRIRAWGLKGFRVESLGGEQVLVSGRNGVSLSSDPEPQENIFRDDVQFRNL